MWLAKAGLAGSVWIAQVKPNTDSNGRFSSPCPTNKLRQRHAGGDQTAGENHLDTACGNCFHETEPGAGSDTGLKGRSAGGRG